MLLPFQGANTIRLALPRVSVHMVRLALGYALLAFQAVFSPFLSNLREIRLCPFRAYPPLLSKPVRQRDESRHIAARRVELRDTEVCLYAQR